MTAIRILHVDDEPDIREIVDMALGLNGDFEVRSCASGAEAVAIAEEWSPLLILLDVMMPGVDGPTTLTLLRKHPPTADIPVLFMTARAQEREVAHFISLGAQGVISKPFDPLTLAFQVRSHLQSMRLATLGYAFTRRAKLDASLLGPLRSPAGKETSLADLVRIKVIAHSLAGTAGLFGFEEISRTAGALEEAVTARLGGASTQKAISRALDCLLAGLESQSVKGPIALAVA
jgi:CheY-like chemotaxis protein